jgi:hypothetical protein
MTDEPKIVTDMRQALSPFGVVVETCYLSWRILFTGRELGGVYRRMIGVIDDDYLSGANVISKHNIPHWDWKSKLIAVLSGINPLNGNCVASNPDAPPLIERDPLVYGALLKAVQALPDCKP